jgi:hypothetical protein
MTMAIEIKTRNILTNVAKSVVLTALLVVFLMGITAIVRVSFDDKPHLPGWYMCVSVK